MKQLPVIIACLSLLALSACGSGGSAGNTPKKSVFDGYVKDVNKAKQVQDKLKAAQKKMSAQLKQTEAGDGGR